MITHINKIKGVPFNSRPKEITLFTQECNITSILGPICLSVFLLSEAISKPISFFSLNTSY